MRVFGWAADQAGCAYYRLHLPLNELAKHGWDTHVHHRMPDNVWLDHEATTIAQRTCLAAPTDRLLDMVGLNQHRTGRHVVFEIDDNLWEIDPTNEVAWDYFRDPNVRRNLVHNAFAADVVTVSTEPLADVLRKITPDVEILPNYVPAWLLEHQPPQRDDGLVTIGWAGSATHQMDWDQCGSEIRRFLARNRGVELHMMGTNYGAWMRIPPDRCRFTPWIGGVEDYLRAIDFHIALAPLRPHVFNRSKSPIKALEAAALGIPVIASDAGPYSDFVRHGETGYLVRQPHEWSRYLRELVNDPDARREMGAKARQQASEWTIERNAWRWAEVLTP